MVTLKLPHPAITSLITVCILYCTCTFTMHSFWESNDDPSAAMLSAGAGICSAPDEHLPYSNIGLGIMLRELYQKWPSCPWYTYNLRLAQIVALYVICYTFLIKRNDINRLALFIVFFITIGIHIIISLQFTTTAALLALSGLCALLIWFEKWDERKIYLFAAFFLFFLSAVLRGVSFELIFALSLSTVISVFMTTKQVRRSLIATIILIAAFAANSMLMWINNRYYAETGWQGFYRLNSARAFFSDYPDRKLPQESMQKIRRELGWSTNDLEMIRLFFFIDKNVFSAETMEAAAAVIPPNKLQLKQILQVLEKIFSNPLIWPAIFTVAFGSIFLDLERFNRKSLLIQGIAVFCLSIVLINRIPPRIYFSIAAYLVAVVLIFVDERKINTIVQNLFQTRKGRAFVISATILGIFALACYIDFSCIKPSQNQSAIRRSLNNALRTLQPSPKDLYYAWATCFPFEMLSPDDNLNVVFKSLNLLPIGSLGQSPPVMERLKQFHLNENEVCQSLYKEENVFLISEQSLFNKCLRQYIEEHYKCKVTFVKVLETTYLAIYQLKKLPLTIEVPFKSKAAISEQ